MLMGKRKEGPHKLRGAGPAPLHSVTSLKVTRNPKLEPRLQVVIKVYLQKHEGRNIFCLTV